MSFSKAVSAAAMCILMGSTAVSAETLKWARASDVQTLDPHAYNEGITHTFNHQIYEPLVRRDDAGKLVPVLATSWKKLDSDPTVWEFKLRQGVTFHDGTPFTADDVKFSIERAQSKTSNVASLVSSITSVEVVDPQTVRLHTKGVNPILVNNLINIFMMSRKWADAHDADVPQNLTAGQESYAAMHEDGTGPYELVSREPDSKTVLKAYDHYWGIGKFPLDIDRIEYTPIQSAATRISALMSGEVNFVQDVPPQDVARLEHAPGIKVVTGPENRSVFFGLNVAADHLSSSDAKGNPFADIRVRHAMNMAINRKVIQKIVMRGMSVPLGTIVPTFVNGYTDDMGKLPKVDIAGAKKLMADAGYGDGFTVTLACTNDSMVNDEAICRSLVPMLAKIGIKVNLDVQPGGVQFPKIAKGKTDFYIMSWGVSTYDSQYLLDNLVHSRSEGKGAWSATGYVNKDIDAKIDSLSSEADTTKRNQTIADIWKVLQDQTIYLPIHEQMKARAMADNINVTSNLGDQVFVKMITVKK